MQTAICVLNYLFKCRFYFCLNLEEAVGDSVITRQLAFHCNDALWLYTYPLVLLAAFSFASRDSISSENLVDYSAGIQSAHGSPHVRTQ